MATPSPSGPPIARDTLVDVLACLIWARVSACLIGYPGSGKSSTVAAVANAFGWAFERKPMPGVTEPVLLAGLPGEEGTRSVIKPYDWLARLLEVTSSGKRSILLFDDIGETSRLIQTALLEVLGDFELGGHRLPLTSMVATANPIGGGLQVTPSMANRIAHLLWHTTPQEQAALMMGDYPQPVIPTFSPDWEMHLPAARREIAVFLKTLQAFDTPDLDAQAVAQCVGPYPSNRTWELSARALAAIDASSLTGERARQARVIAVKSLVGPTAANAFFTFLQFPNMLKPVDVLGNPNLVRERRELFRPEKMDEAFIFLGAMTRFVVGAKTVESWIAAWKVLGIFADHKAIPVCAPFVLILNGRRPQGAPENVPQMSQFGELLAKR